MPQSNLLFRLDQQNCKLTNVNPRAEYAGEETRPASDLTISFSTTNAILNDFDPKLKAALYERDDDTQAELISTDDHLTKLKFPLAGRMRWGAEFEGQTVIINYGIGGPSDVKLGDCKVNKFSFECMEGGSVNVTFRVQGHPTPEDIGKLYTLIQQETKITVRPPSTAEEELNIANRKALEDLFSGTPADDGDEEGDEEGDEQDPLAGSDLAGGAQPGQPDSDDPELFDKVVEFLSGLNSVSVSIIRREFKVETLTAQRVLDQLLAEDLIGEPDAHGLHPVKQAA